VHKPAAAAPAWLPACFVTPSPTTTDASSRRVGTRVTREGAMMRVPRALSVAGAFSLAVLLRCVLA
jgi:hypothetical protein